MKYLCLAWYDERRLAALPQAEVAAIASRCPPHDEALRASGHLLAAASLGPSGASMSLRPANGGVSIAEGPFAAHAERIGGFFVIEAQDLNEAIRIAAKHPAAHVGESAGWGIEVRPIERFESR